MARAARGNVLAAIIDFFIDFFMKIRIPPLPTRNSWQNNLLVSGAWIFENNSLLVSLQFPAPPSF